MRFFDILGLIAIIVAIAVLLDNIQAAYDGMFVPAMHKFTNTTAPNYLNNIMPAITSNLVWLTLIILFLFIAYLYNMLKEKRVQ